MSKPPFRLVKTPSVPEPPSGAYSNCFAVGDTIYISGQHAGAPQGVIGGNSVREQSREAFRRIFALIEAAGGSADDIVKLTVYLCDMAGRNDLSAMRRELFAGPLPCSTLIGVKELASPDLLVEIDAVAVLGSGGRRSAMA